MTKLNLKEIRERCEPELADWVERISGCARGMRSSQKEYFKTRSRKSLITSKQLEKELDNLLSELEP